MLYDIMKKRKWYFYNVDLTKNICSVGYLDGSTFKVMIKYINFRDAEYLVQLQNNQRGE